MSESRPNPSIKLDAHMPDVEAVEEPVFKWRFDKEVAQQWSAPFFIFMPFSRSNGKGSDFSWADRLV
jgi:hypothetical protein